MSDIAILQKLVDAEAASMGHNRDPKVILLFLLEELGETARAFLKEIGHKESNDRVVESYKQELGDVFFLLLSLAASRGIDLEEQLHYTIKKLKTRTPEEL
jgi:NTP pyrophosphatase (non-canonical NTP hydrolase)